MGKAPGEMARFLRCLYTPRSARAALLEEEWGLPAGGRGRAQTPSGSGPRCSTLLHCRLCTHTLTGCAPDLLCTLRPGGGPPTVTFRWHLEAVAKLADEYDAPGWQRRHATPAGAATGAAGRTVTALTLIQLATLAITLTPALPHICAEVLEECVAALQEPLGAFLAKLDAARWLQVLVRAEPPGRLCLQTCLESKLGAYLLHWREGRTPGCEMRPDPTRRTLCPAAPCCCCRRCASGLRTWRPSGSSRRRWRRRCWRGCWSRTRATGRRARRRRGQHQGACGSVGGVGPAFVNQR